MRVRPTGYALGPRLAIPIAIAAAPARADEPPDPCPVEIADDAGRAAVIAAEADYRLLEEMQDVGGQPITVEFIARICESSLRWAEAAAAAARTPAERAASARGHLARVTAIERALLERFHGCVQPRTGKHPTLTLARDYLIAAHRMVARVSPGDGF